MTKVMDRINFSQGVHRLRCLHGFDPVTKTSIVVALVAPEQSVQEPPATKWQAITTGRIVAEGEDVDACLQALADWFERWEFAQPA